VFVKTILSLYLKLKREHLPGKLMTILHSKIEEMRYFTFYPMLDEMIRGIDERSSQETLNLIASMVNILKLQTDDTDIKILSEAFNLKNIHTEIINIPEIESICGSPNINISKWLDWLVDNGRSEKFSFL